MRKIFFIAAKLLGLLQLFWLLASSLQVVFGLCAVIKMESTSSALVALAIAGSVLFVVVTLIFAVLLLFKTDWLADILHIPRDITHERLDQSNLLYVGAKLIGLYILVQGLPFFVKALFELRHIAPYSLFMWSTTIPGLVQIALGLLILLKTKNVVALITKDAGRQNNQIQGTGDPPHGSSAPEL